MTPTDLICPTKLNFAQPHTEKGHKMTCELLLHITLNIMVPLKDNVTLARILSYM